MVKPAKFTQKILPLTSRHCNPNSATLRSGMLYIVCNSDFGGRDNVPVYDAKTLAQRYDMPAALNP